ASLARPGGNVTGLAVQSNELVGKRIELLREVVPGLRRLAIMGNVDNPFAALQTTDAQAAARKLGLGVVTVAIRRAHDNVPAFETLKGRRRALYLRIAAVANTSRLPISCLAVGARLPPMPGSRDYVEAGGLMSFGANFPDQFPCSADCVAKILRGAKPAAFPV